MTRLQIDRLYRHVLRHVWIFILERDLYQQKEQCHTKTRIKSAFMCYVS